uniref:Phosphatidylinositol 3-kinase catalytic subunit type 3 n=1 Tax=Culicoides sonorensis TaxID=179676 RepID=A0A336M345_CULSO
MESFDKVDEKFHYVYSCSLEKRIPIKVGTLEGVQQKPSFEKLLEDPLLRFSGLYAETDEGKCASFMIRLQVYNNGKSLGLPIQTSYRAFTTRWSWNEWVTLPVHFSDLPRTAVLALTILDCAGPGKTTVVGGTTISFFGRNGVFRQGLFDLRVWPNVEADGNVPSSTPGKGHDSAKHQMQRLAKLAKMHRNGQIPKVDWLDRLTFREIELINQNEKQQSDYLYLMIEFPTIEMSDKPYTIVYYEPDGDMRIQYVTKPKLVTVPDSEILLDNLVEVKHHRLARATRFVPSDKDAKPTAEQRNKLDNIILHYPPTQSLSSEEQDLLWKYRFYLKREKKALIKFLKCINWEIESGTSAEVKQALDIMVQWTPMDVEDALELLTPAFKHPTVRRYAITRLNQAPDDDLLLYLLQLVQALKYESFESILNKDKEILKSIDDNACDQMSESTSVSDKMTSSQHGSIEGRHTPASLLDEAPPSVFPVDTGSSSIVSDISITRSSDLQTVPSDLASFLIQRACRNSNLANYLYWFLSIECEPQDISRKQDDRVRAMYVAVKETFMKTLHDNHFNIYKNLKEQQFLIDELVNLVQKVTKESGNRQRKIEKFQSLLANWDSSSNFKFINFSPRPLPLNPEIYVKGILPQKATLFKSALMPSKMTFMTVDNREYVAIFKHGDDLRQDQLILQMITLMDKLLQKEKVDLKLTPYRVLATSSKHGLVQFIDSVTVAEVLKTDGTIQNFFRKHHPDENGPNGIAREVMDTYIRSCAGYCVITYILGVGDRHLDNLLLTTSGKLFHIDFGYILGRDPKPLPPPMKLSKEMVEGMGGIQSEFYNEFKKQCYTAFLHLRRHANVMLNLFSLMIDASVPDIALEPDKAVKKVEDNLQLGLSDEEAVQHLQQLLDISVSAVMPAVMDFFHRTAQIMRN